MDHVYEAGFLVDQGPFPNRRSWGARFFDGSHFDHVFQGARYMIDWTFLFIMCFRVIGDAYAVGTKE